MKTSTRLNNIIFALFLTIIFIALKLDGVLQCNWIFVINPIWVAILVDVVATIVVAIINTNKGVNKANDI